jgi:hypothetical protein
MIYVTWGINWDQLMTHPFMSIFDRMKFFDVEGIHGRARTNERRWGSKATKAQFQIKNFIKEIFIHNFLK